MSDSLFLGDVTSVPWVCVPNGVSDTGAAACESGGTMTGTGRVGGATGARVVETRCVPNLAGLPLPWPPGSESTEEVGQLGQ